MAKQTNTLKSEITGIGMEITNMLTGIFNAIHRESDEFSEIKRLAKAGSHLGNDYFSLVQLSSHFDHNVKS